MNSFFTGQVVVCINPNRWQAKDSEGEITYVAGPKMGETYVIRGIDSTGKGLLLDRYIVTLKYTNGTEAGYHYSGFRPLVAYKNDISIFKALLDPGKQELAKEVHPLPVPHTSQP